MVTQLVRARLRDLRVAPALGTTLAVVLAGNRQQNLLGIAADLAAQAVSDNREVIRDRVRAESPWWVPGVIDDKLYQKILAAIERLLRDVGADQSHPLRATFDAALRDFIDRLQHSPEVIAKAEAMKADWLSDPQVEELAGRLWEEARHAVVAYATGAELAWSPYANPGPGNGPDDIVGYQVHRSVSQVYTPSAATLVTSLGPQATRFVDTTAPVTPDSAPDLGWNAYYYMIVVRTRSGELIPSANR